MMSLIVVLALAAAPCDGVVDRTAECPGPASEAASIHADAKPAPAPIPGVDPSALPSELAFASLVLALGGGGALAWSYATAPQDEGGRFTHDVVRGIGIGTLIWSGMVAAGAFGLWFFDPSTGGLRPKIYGEHEG
jgi:hypothetical protein